MNWPSHTDYQDAMQNPSMCFHDPELKSGEAKTDMLGLPRVMSGNFASVYELHCGDHRWAIRCFVRQVPGQQGRYARLSQHLNSLTLPCLVGFDYILKGLLVKGEGYPVVKMQWVEGMPLNTWVEEHLTNPEALKKLAAGWRAMMKDLAQHKLAHGDLQHGNVMVTPEDELRLVDYDGMYAPVFGRGRAPELGHINFQHPRRTADFYQEDLDNFSAVVIYTSLLALASEPELWDKYYTVDNLVFTSADFKNPLNSPLFERLHQSKDPQVQQLAKLLEKCCLAPVENVPDFLVAMEALDQGTLECLPMKTPAPAASISFSRPAPETTGATGSGLPASRPAPAAAGKKASRSSYEQMPDVATQSLKQSRPAPQGSRSAYEVPEEKSAGIPWWAWGVVGLLVAVIGALIIIVNRPQDPMESNHVERIRPAARSSSRVEVPPAELEEPIQSVQASTPVAARDLPKARGSSLKIIPLGSMKGHSASVDVLTFSPDGKWLASGSADKSIKIWDAQSGQPKRTLSAQGETMVALRFLSEGKIVAGVGADNSIRFWDATTGDLQKKIDDYKDNLFAVALSRDGQTIATGLSSDRKAVRLVDIFLGSVKRSFPNHESWVRSVNFSRNGKMFVSVCHDDSVNIWDISSGQKIQSFSVPGNNIETPVFSADNRFLATSSEGVEMKIWDVQTGRIVHTLSGHAGEIKTCAFSSDGKWLATGSADRTIKIWDVASGTEKQTLSGHTDAINALTFSGNNTLLVSGSADQTIKLWEIQR
ncbi:MAG: hypothetical protein H0X66_07475 [Verrucomicrobia bacterium]|nr:hypothetical protein [Verrucomicrobiota bacterium]